MGAEDMTKQDLFNQLKDLIIATEDRLAARTDKTDARLDGIASDFNAWRPRLEGRVDALQSAVAALQRQAATNVPPAEVPTPANPTDEVPAPAISDSDAKLVTIDVGGPAAPAPTTAPTEHMTTVDIVPVLAAPAATDGTLHGQAVSGVPSTPVTCSIVCLPRHPVATPVLVASSTPALPECVLDTNTILVAAVPLTMNVEFPAITMPTDSAPKVWLQQLYNGSEFFMPTSSLCITTKVHVHRPMPWPSFEDIHADGVDARPWPWPSFMEDYGCEALSKTTVKPSQWRSSDSSCAKSCAASNRSYFLDGQANGDEARPLPWPSFSVICDCESPSYAVMKQSWHCSCVSSPATLCGVIKFSVTTFYGTIYGFHWLAMVRRSELKLLMISSKFVTLLIILVDSGNFAAFNCAYLGVDTTPCIGSWLFAGCLLFVCLKSAVKPSTDCYIAILIVAGLGSIMDCHLLGYPCRSVITACLSCSLEHCPYCCSSQRKEIWILNSRRSSNSSYDHFCCAIQDVLCWPGNFVTGINMHTRAASIRRLLLIGYVTVVPFLNLVKVLVQPNKQHSELVYVSGRCLEISSVMFHMIQNILTYMLQHWDSCRPKSAMTHLQPTIPGMYLCLSACIRAVGFVLCKMCSLQMLRPHKCMHGNSTTTKCVQSVACPNDVLYPQTLFLLDMHLLKVKCKEQVAVCCNCITGRQFYVGTNTIWNSYSNYCMMIVSNSSFISMKLLRQSDDVHLQLWPMHKFPLISRAGIFAPVILTVVNHWWNCIKDQWLYFLWCGVLLAELTILIICKTGWPPCALACFIITKGDMPWLLVEMRMPISTTYAGELSGEQWDSVLGCLFKAIKGLHIDHTFNQDQVCTDHDY